MGRPIDLRLSASATHRRSPAAQPLSSLSLRNRSERRRDTAIEMSRALAGREFAERNVMEYRAGNPLLSPHVRGSNDLGPLLD